MGFLGKRKRRNQSDMRPWTLGVIAVVIAFALGLRVVNYFKEPEVVRVDVPSVSYDDIVTPPAEAPAAEPVEPVIDPTPTEPEPEPPTSAVPPASLNLALPFTSQAPTGNWDPLHEDACEEASFYMVLEFYKGTPEGKIDPALADPAITKMVHAEEAMGLEPSITAQQSADFLGTYAGVDVTILDNPTVDEIKQLLAAGKPVIVPAKGRELGNPNFTGEGPLYHMLVIRGYTATQFITNDPGTRLGEEYVYDIDVLMAAIGDWNDGDPVNGAKRVFVIEPMHNP